MTYQIKQLVGMLLVAIAILIITPTPAQAQWSSRCAYTDAAGDQIPTLQGFECIFERVLSIAIQLVGIVMLIMIVFGGFKYATAGGDPKAVESARGTLTMAIAGMALTILAWFILQIIATLTGVPVHETPFIFEIPN